MDCRYLQIVVKTHTFEHSSNTTWLHKSPRFGAFSLTSNIFSAVSPFRSCNLSHIPHFSSTFEHFLISSTSRDAGDTQRAEESAHLWTLFLFKSLLLLPQGCSGLVSTHKSRSPASEFSHNLCHLPLFQTTTALLPALHKPPIPVDSEKMSSESRTWTHRLSKLPLSCGTSISIEP